MLTSVQKEILQTLINLYQSSSGKSIKGEDIAEVMGRNPGTIRNQMQSLRSLGLVKGVPGPRGGYKPTIEAYHSLNISVSDQGIGIAPDKQPLVFERFYRVPHGNLHDVKGYGLGLFYVKSLMEKHGGNVNLQSIEGKGSTFTLTFTES